MIREEEEDLDAVVVLVVIVMVMVEIVLVEIVLVEIVLVEIVLVVTVIKEDLVEIVIKEEMIAVIEDLVIKENLVVIKKEMVMMAVIVVDITMITKEMEKLVGRVSILNDVHQMRVLIQTRVHKADPRLNRKRNRHVKSSNIIMFVHLKNLSQTLDHQQRQKQWIFCWQNQFQRSIYLNWLFGQSLLRLTKIIKFNV